jgi:tetratricopeptide (TPR) repeat protein
MLADRADRLDESVELIQRALESDPHNGAYLDSLGWAYFQLEEWELAETYLRQAAEQMTRDSVIQDHFGDVLFQRGQFTEAVEAWERALAGDVESIEPSVIERKIEGARQRGGR